MDLRFADVSDPLWKLLQRTLPKRPQRSRVGRPRIDDRRVFAGIVYRLRTGCQWKAIPSCFGSGSTCHARFSEWCASGVFERAFAVAVRYYDAKQGIRWDWCSLDSAMVKAPKDGTLTGRNPTDRGKSGVKRHILTDGRGVPLAAELSGANVHDKRLALPTLDAIIVRSSRGPRRPQNLCLDKGYDYRDVQAGIRARRITPHIRRRGEVQKRCIQGKPRRWVVERTNAWHNRFRGLLVRWERIASHYRALLHLASAIIAFREAVRLSRT